jgi:hypothetical protein
LVKYQFSEHRTPHTVEDPSIGSQRYRGHVIHGQSRFTMGKELIEDLIAGSDPGGAHDPSKVAIVREFIDEGEPPVPM